MTKRHFFWWVSCRPYSKRNSSIVFLTCWCWTLKAFPGSLKKIQLYFNYFSRFIYLCFFGCCLVFSPSLPEVKRELTHNLSRLLVWEKSTIYHKRCKAWPVVTLGIKLWTFVAKSRTRVCFGQNFAATCNIEICCDKFSENDWKCFPYYLTFSCTTYIQFWIKSTRLPGRNSSKLTSTLNYPPDPYKVDHTTLLFSNSDGGCKGISSCHLTSVRSRFNDHGVKKTRVDVCILVPEPLNQMKRRALGTRMGRCFSACTLRVNLEASLRHPLRRHIKPFNWSFTPEPLNEMPSLRSWGAIVSFKQNQNTWSRSVGHEEPDMVSVDFLFLVTAFCFRRG